MALLLSVSLELMGKVNKCQEGLPLFPGDCVLCGKSLWPLVSRPEFKFYPCHLFSVTCWNSLNFSGS